MRIVFCSEALRNVFLDQPLPEDLYLEANNATTAHEVKTAAKNRLDDYIHGYAIQIITKTGRRYRGGWVHPQDPLHCIVKKSG